MDFAAPHCNNRANRRRGAEYPWERSGSGRRSSARRIRRCWPARAVSSTTYACPGPFMRRSCAVLIRTRKSSPFGPRRRESFPACTSCSHSPTCRKRCAAMRCRCSCRARRSPSFTCPMRWRAPRPSMPASRSQSWSPTRATSRKTRPHWSRSITSRFPACRTAPPPWSRRARAPTSTRSRTLPRACPSPSAMPTPPSPRRRMWCASASSFIAAARFFSNAAASSRAMTPRPMATRFTSPRRVRTASSADYSISSSSTTTRCTSSRPTSAAASARRARSIRNTPALPHARASSAVR
jgi:hypothetical protein